MLDFSACLCSPVKVVSFDNINILSAHLSDLTFHIVQAWPLGNQDQHCILFPTNNEDKLFSFRRLMRAVSTANGKPPTGILVALVDKSHLNLAKFRSSYEICVQLYSINSPVYSWGGGEGYTLCNI